jgi:hypothetical protein
MQTCFRFEDTVVPLSAPFCVDISQIAAAKCANGISDLGILVSIQILHFLESFDVPIAGMLIKPFIPGLKLYGGACKTNEFRVLMAITHASDTES